MVIPGSHVYICFVLSSSKAREKVGKSREVNLLPLAYIFAMWKYLSFSNSATGVTGLPVPPFLLLAGILSAGTWGEAKTLSGRRVDIVWSASDVRATPATYDNFIVQFLES